MAFKSASQYGTFHRDRKPEACFVLQVLQPLVQDLKALEEGVDGMKAGVLAYSADNLEVHDLGMFQRNFNSGYPCHYCLIPHRHVTDNLS
jgi:hypothetical protein